MHKSNRMRSTPCRHSADRDTCPDCAQEQYDAYLADQIAQRDSETHSRWVAEFEAWLAQDPPRLSPEIVP